MSRWLARENPAHPSETVGRVVVAEDDDVDAAVRQAEAAQREWAASSHGRRAEVVAAAFAGLAGRVDDLGLLLAREMGKPLADARGEAGFALRFAAWAGDRSVEVLADRQVDDAQGRLLLQRKPYGVVAAVTPWNAPLILTVLKLAPALLAGNAVVVKPSPLAPLAVTAMCEAVGDRLPSGLLAVVHGGAGTGAALVSHAGVAKVAFTGGAAAGRAIGRLAGEALTPLVLELGGNDAAVLLDDTHLDDAAMDRLVMASFATSGQVCMAAKRVYVPRSRHDDVVEAYLAAAQRVLVLGDPVVPGVTLGPLVTRDAVERLAALVDAAVARGAQRHDLGRVAGDLGDGYFLAPTLLTGCRDDDPVVADEQFGPTVPVLAYDDVDEVLARANAGDLGLGASVWSADEDRAFDVARRFEAGFAFVNTHNRTGMSLRAPFGGVKRSGFGREYGDEGLLEYAQTCVVHAPAAFRPGAGHATGHAAYPSS